MMRLSQLCATSSSVPANRHPRGRVPRISRGPSSFPRYTRTMPVVALTGGVGAGKSTVTEVLASCGAHIIDADALAREAVAHGSAGLERIRERFGSSVFGPDGALDRSALGALVFADPSARGDLNAIVHPIVHELYDAALQEAQRTDPEALVIYDVPLLAEARSASEFDLVVVVHTPAEERVSRLVHFRGLDPKAAQARVNSQASDEQRLALADVVLDSSRSIEDTRAAARELCEELERAWPDRLDTVARSFPRKAS